VVLRTASVSMKKTALVVVGREVFILPAQIATVCRDWHYRLWQNKYLPPYNNQRGFLHRHQGILTIWCIFPRVPWSRLLLARIQHLVASINPDTSHASLQLIFRLGFFLHRSNISSFRPNQVQPVFLASLSSLLGFSVPHGSGRLSLQSTQIPSRLSSRLLLVSCIKHLVPWTDLDRVDAPLLAHLSSPPLLLSSLHVSVVSPLWPT